MRGFVVKFDRERGYGFIHTREHPSDLFVHIHQVRNQQILVPGQPVVFDVEETEKGWAAVRVIPGRKRVSPYALYGTIAFLFIASLTAHLAVKGMNVWLAYFLSINACTFLFYGYDKWIAGTSLLRVPEWILQGLAFGGGSPLALASQKIFHHKTIKRSFQFVYWAIVILQVLLGIGIFFF